MNERRLGDGARHRQRSTVRTMWFSSLKTVAAMVMAVGLLAGGAAC